MSKRWLETDVYSAAQTRIAFLFDRFSRLYLAFSGGKDSTVALHLIGQEARRRGRRFGLLFIDLEAQYKLTIEHVEACFAAYADVVDPFWVSLPIVLRNAVSVYEPRWLCWDPNTRGAWVRRPPDQAVQDERFFPFFRRGMEFEEFTPAFGRWYGSGQPTAAVVGIRAHESLNRYRTLVAHKVRFEGRCWTTEVLPGLYNAYPIYDWRTEDIWTYHAKHGGQYNPLYERMHKAGLSIHQQRICQPYGDDQRKGLWLYQVIEPETWGRVVARVNGANMGALYAREQGNVLGVGGVQLPPGHTWQSFAELIFASLPDRLREHYKNKVARFIKWWMDRGYPDGIPDEAPPQAEASKEAPSWRRVCKSLLRNDYWCKWLGFAPTNSAAYQRYLTFMIKRRKEWKILSPSSGPLPQP